MNVDSETLRRARAALSERQEEYHARRSAQADKARRELPRAAELARKIRRVFTDALCDVFDRNETMEKAARDSLELQKELCDLLCAHGFEPDILFDKPLCSKCKDTGYLGARMCECLRGQVAQECRGSMAMPEDGTFERFDIDLFSETPHPDWGLSQRENMEGNLKYCKNWAKRFGETPSNLFLNGGTGQGKTFLCACIANMVASNGFSVCYTTAVRLFDDMESRKFERGADNTDVSRYFCSDLLIIDDLGTEMTTAFVQSALYDIINTRMAARRATIINANLSADQLAERYLPQICSRLLGEYRTLHFFGPDLRMSRRAAKRFTI